MAAYNHTAKMPLAKPRMLNPTIWLIVKPPLPSAVIPAFHWGASKMPSTINPRIFNTKPATMPPRTTRVGLVLVIRPPGQRIVFLLEDERKGAVSGLSLARELSGVISLLVVRSRPG